MNAAQEFSLCFARAFGAPRLSGRFRGRVEDFEVDELLGFEPAGAGEHVYLHVRKVGANTDWAARRIAGHASVRARDVGYAGRKDRHGIATQWFSCWLPGRLAPDFSKLNAEGLAVLRVRRHERKLRRGMHAGNRFRIRIRDLAATGDRDSAEADLHRRVERIQRDGFPNYFGEQRFGNQGNNLRHADDLMRGRAVSERKRDLYLSAARSYLFNRDLSRRVAAGDWRDECGWLFGTSRTPLPVAREASLADWYAGLERVGVKAQKRPRAIVPGHLEYEIQDGDLSLAFELPAGSYATSLLRELIDYRGEAAHEDTDVG
jgi:tRNA pseudouridine13 synthase